VHDEAFSGSLCKKKGFVNIKISKNMICIIELTPLTSLLELRGLNV
jgi:hypothetical protein